VPHNIQPVGAAAIQAVAKPGDILNLRAHTGIAIALLACLPGIAAASLQCSETDPRGNHSVATIRTDKSGAIESFHWTMRTRKGASCDFDSRKFAYVPKSAAHEYRSAEGCRLFIWEQGDSVVLAPHSCEANCTGPEAHDYLWPVVFDRRGKDCGRNR
jgi:hypothetical protein